MCAVVAALLIGAYSGIWYLGCQGIESKLLKQQFSFYLGPNNEVAIDVTIRISELKYAGYFQGASIVQYRVDDMYSSVALSQEDKPKEILLETRAKPTGDPIIYSVGVPLWGTSVHLRSGKLNGLKIENKSKAGTSTTILSGDPTDASILLRNEGFIATRAALLKELIADPKKIASELVGFRINKPFSIKMADPSTQKLFMDMTYHGGGFGWDVTDGMFTFTYDLAMEGKYGPAFFDLMAASQRAQTQKALSPSLQKLSNSITEAMKSVLSDGSIQSRGSVVISLPAARMGLAAKPAEPQESAVPPFSIIFNEFYLQSPFFLNSGTTIDGKVGFQQAGGKPLLIDLSIKQQSGGSSLPLQKFKDAVLELPEVKQLALDSTKSGLSSITSFRDLEGRQGAFVGTVSALTAFEKVVLSNPASLALQVEVSTQSGKLNPIDLLGAPFSSRITGQLGATYGIDVKASGRGAETWNLSVGIKGLSALIRELREPLSVFITRAFLATFLEIKDSSPEPSQPERDLLTFLFSDQLFSDLLVYLEEVSQGVDMTPETPEELQINFVGSSQSATVNGKSLAEFEADLSARVTQQGEMLRQKVETQLAQFGRDLL
jgi:hypothetical protein